MRSLRISRGPLRATLGRTSAAVLILIFAGCTLLAPLEDHPLGTAPCDGAACGLDGGGPDASDDAGGDSGSVSAKLTMTTTPNAPSVAQGKKVTVAVDIQRTNFDALVSVSLDGLTADIAATPVPLVIPAGSTHGTIDFTAASDATVGAHHLTVRAASSLDPNVAASVNLDLLVSAPSGTLDTTFGTGGKVTTTIGASDADLFALAIQSDGKVVAVGEAYPGATGGDFAVARYNVDGSLDSTFGSSGIVTTDFGGTVDTATGVAIQSDGKIVVGGLVTIGGNPTFGLARYTTAGAPDTSFGTGGRASPSLGTNPAAAVTGIALQPDGKILVVGEYGGNNLLVRYTSVGAFDATFGSGGAAKFAIGAYASNAASLVVQPDGKIVVAGWGKVSTNGHLDFGATRIDGDGGVDSIFGEGGSAVEDWTGDAGNGGGSYANAVTLDSTEILAAGVTSTTRGVFGVVRYLANGTPDTTFGSGGLAYADMGSNSSEAKALIVQPDGKIVLVGEALNSFNPYFGVARFTASGALDTSFASTGKVSFQFLSETSGYGATAVALEPDHRIVVGGTINDGTNARFALARIWP